MTNKLLTMLRGGVSALAIGLLLSAGLAMVSVAVIPTPAVADEDGHSSGESGNGKGPQFKGGGDAGHGGQGGQGGHESDASGEDGSDGRGPQYGKPDESRGKPVWSAEGIPEVELGRLNVSRSPSHVLDQAYNEALSNLTPAMLAFYGKSYAEVLSLLENNWDDLSIIDSPLQNLALLKDALDGSSVINDYLAVDADLNTLMAIFIGVASDKTVPISTNTVAALTKILGFSMPEAQAAALAAQAENVRLAVAAGHG